MARIRKRLVAPIVWWARNTEAKPALQQSAWERGKSDAIVATKDGRAFGLVATGVTCAVPTAVGFATTKLATGFQVALIVLSAFASYVLIPVAWAVVSAVVAPLRQRNEARKEIVDLEAARAALTEKEVAESQFAAALRVGHLLETIEAPTLAADWLSKTELLVHDAVGQLEAALLSPQQTVSERLAKLERLVGEISQGTRSISPSETWERYTTMMLAVAEGLALTERAGRDIRADIFANEITVDDAPGWVSRWLKEASDFEAIVPAVRGLVVERPHFWATYKGLSDELSREVSRLDRQLTALQDMLPTLELYAQELRSGPEATS